MTVLPPSSPVESSRVEDDRTPENTPAAEPAVASSAPFASSSPPSERRRTTVERLVLGILLAAVGAGWLLDEVGVSVPWALAPAVGVVVIGIALVVTAGDGGRHAPLVVWGAVLLVAALAVTAVRPVGGTVGDRYLTPTASQWPVATSVAAGNLTIDLRHNALPASGRLTAHVDAGNVVVHLPEGSGAKPVKVVAHVGVGQISVDGVDVRDGFGLDWTSSETAPVVVDVQVGAGNVEVDHG